MDRRNWSRLEVEATVEVYLQMLLLELKNKSYNKTQLRRDLRKILNNRSEPAIERKHQNISAVLIELGLPYVNGYKPLGNYQALLREVVESRVNQTNELVSTVTIEIERPIEVPTVDNILDALVDPPSSPEKTSIKYIHEKPIPRQQTRPNYLLREASNTILGRAGEEYALNFERARLLAERKDSLAAKIEHVSNTRGDYEGFDILSFESDGRERLIEVKTTGFGKYTPFYVTSNELAVSQRERESYYLYRLFEFRREPHLFTLNGSLEQSFKLDPSQYVARVR